MPPRAEVPHDGDEGSEGADDPTQALFPHEDMSPEDAVAFLVTMMEDHPHDVTLVDTCLRGLSSLMFEHPVVVVASDATTHVFAVLQNHSNHETLVELSLHFLLGIQSATQNANVASVDEPGRIESVVSVLGEYPDNQDVQRCGALVLCCWARDEGARDKVVETDAVEAIIFAMDKLSSETQVQYVCCAGVSALMENDNSGNVKERIEEAGGIRHLVNLIQHHGGHPHAEDSIEAQTLPVVFESITFIVKDRDTAMATVVELDGISAILSTMQHQTSNEEIVYEAAKLLRCLGGNDDTTQAFIAAGGIATLIAILKEHPDRGAIFAAVCVAITGISAGNHTIPDAFASEGGLAEVMRIMPRHVSSVHLQVFAIGAIGSVVAAEGSVHAKHVIRSIPNFADCIVAAMHEHVGDEDLQILGCTVLRDLGFSVKMCHDIVRSGGVPALVTAMKNFQLNERLQDAAVCAVGNIANAGIIAKSECLEVPIDMIEVIKESGAVAYTISILRRVFGTDNDTLAFNAVHLLRTMAEANEGVKDQLMSSGVQRLLASIHKEAGGDTAVEAALLLQCMEASENDENRKVTESTFGGTAH